MKRMLFVSFDQPEKVMGRLSVYVGREKVCTLSNHEKFDGVELEGGRQIIRAEFFPSLWLLPFVRRRSHTFSEACSWAPGSHGNMCFRRRRATARCPSPSAHPEGEGPAK